MSVHVPELYLVRFNKNISSEQYASEKGIAVKFYVSFTRHMILAIGLQDNLGFRFIEVLIDGQIQRVRYEEIDGKRMRIVRDLTNTSSVSLHYRKDVQLDELEHEKNIARQQYKKIFGEDAHE